ncbi:MULTISPECIES: aminoacyl-tRNA hydrolase [Cupriavidus]|uniref:Peptidyl-tRNA hydrolase n=2 Tax=Cupriavidus pinatubonensis TaxID=248026 RepID=PTH_CUPPJ|nr:MULTISPECIES: aminoacyl-tRNA hydrolase [Cupriavidus]Q476G1.1 RecName: Full=Peptidyl-tRNA hydrolase; Short=PTH [Cupriavidus pinatubonensis JMP134]QYY31956.1 aminoacyl-tRNA hydrolase [Cupriavidus pinatubonensis]TPQ41978.1 peptidyl-tRNA hydrolase [Cupriavidus pinatubonensis]CAG9163427.1 Peptidyl-tRNA hydrolase [Cupriavidus pinatubonensis]
MIKLIVGLGNPGAEYEATRHNAGFWLVDQLARMGGTTLRVEGRFHGLAGRARLWDQDIWLLKPSTFMNRSGLAVVSLARFYKILPDEIVVAHDEMDLPPGAAKLKRGGGAGGHNGLKDIAAHLTTQEFWRLRLGVGHPRNLPGGAGAGREDVVNFVLKPPRKEEQQAIDEAIDRSIDPLGLLARGDAERAMAQLHTVAR